MLTNFAERINALKDLCNQHGVSGYIVSSCDEFGNECPPQHLERLSWLSGFSGSNGVLIVTQKQNIFFTDSRYLLQAELELKGSALILDMYKQDSCGLLFSALEQGAALGYDPMIESVRNLEYYQKLALQSDFQMIALEKNLIDLLWLREESSSAIEIISLENSGMSHKEKLSKTAEAIDADYLFLCKLDSIAWLLNIRGNDLEHSPLMLAYAFISRTEHCFLFTDATIDNELAQVTVSKLSEAQAFFKKLVNSNQRIQTDEHCAAWFAQIAGSQLKIASDPISLAKSCKNDIEISNIKKAHHEDGVALARFFCWLYRSVDSNITELDAAQQLLEYRKESTSFVSQSFATISAFGANGAIVHYRPNKISNKKITKNGLYLVDSGGQYRYGTTDVTRVFCFGQPTAIEKRNYTLVLKGMLRLSNAKFPVGTSGAQLDALARYDLWQNGLDYGHGTGHGVGYFLNVHEGPQGISKANRVPLLPGMIISNEPGYYEKGAYGIRIENLLLVKPSAISGFLEFETLTLAPIAVNLVDENLLSEEEKQWLYNYNAQVLATMAKRLDSAEQNALRLMIDIS